MANLGEPSKAALPFSHLLCSYRCSQQVRGVSELREGGRIFQKLGSHGAGWLLKLCLKRLGCSGKSCEAFLNLGLVLARRGWGGGGVGGVL